jgi:hypothetical protein
LRGDDIYQLITYASFCGCAVIVPIYPKYKGVESDTTIGWFEILLHGKVLILVPMQVELGTEKDFKKIAEIVQSISY